MANHLKINSSLIYANSLGTASTSQMVNAWDNVDDDHMDFTGDGRLSEMAGCLDAPERIPAGSTKPWNTIRKYASSSYTIRQ